MIELNLLILKKIFSFILKYFYLFLFLLICSFAFTDLYLKKFTEKNINHKLIKIDVNIDNLYEQMFNVGNYNLNRKIYTNLLLYNVNNDLNKKIHTNLLEDKLEDKVLIDLNNTYNNTYKEGDDLKVDGFNAVNFNKSTDFSNIQSVKSIIIAKIDEAIVNDVFLIKNTEPYKTEERVDSKVILYLDSKFNEQENSKIIELIYENLNNSLSLSFKNILDDFYLYSGYTNFLTKKQISNKNNIKFVKLINEQNKKLNESFEEAIKAIDYFAISPNYFSIKIEEFNKNIPSFLATFIISLLIINLIFFIFLYLYFYIRTD